MYYTCNIQIVFCFYISVKIFKIYILIDICMYIYIYIYMIKKSMMVYKWIGNICEVFK